MGVEGGHPVNGGGGSWGCERDRSRACSRGGAAHGRASNIETFLTISARKDSLEEHGYCRSRGGAPSPGPEATLQGGRWQGNGCWPRREQPGAPEARGDHAGDGWRREGSLKCRARASVLDRSPRRPDGSRRRASRWVERGWGGDGQCGLGLGQRC